MEKPRQVVQDITILPTYFTVHGAGFLPVNAFVIKSEEPVLVDTGLGIESEEFMEALRSVIDPRDLKWVWLTHDDADHTGCIQEVLEAAPGARLVANSLAVLRMSSYWSVPMDRVYWLNPGDGIEVGDRRLTAVRPPLFDNPTTIGIHDSKSETFFSADCFGAIIQSPADNAEDIPEEDLARGVNEWASVDNPWVHLVDPDTFNRTLDEVRGMAPKNILSGHLPPAIGMDGRLLELLAGVPASTPFVAPDQSALVQILAAMKGGS